MCPAARSTPRGSARVDGRHFRYRRSGTRAPEPLARRAPMPRELASACHPQRRRSAVRASRASVVPFIACSFDRGLAVFEVRTVGPRPTVRKCRWQDRGSRAERRHISDLRAESRSISWTVVLVHCHRDQLVDRFWMIAPAEELARLRTCRAYLLYQDKELLGAQLMPARMRGNRPQILPQSRLFERTSGEHAAQIGTQRALKDGANGGRRLRAAFDVV